MGQRKLHCLSHLLLLDVHTTCEWRGRGREGREWRRREEGQRGEEGEREERKEREGREGREGGEEGGEKEGGVCVKGGGRKCYS